MTTYRLDDFLTEEMERDPAFAAEWRAGDAAFQFRLALIRARLDAGLTQHQLAQRVGTTQSVIARLEAGGSSPRLSTLQRLSNALGIAFVVAPHAPVSIKPAA